MTSISLPAEVVFRIGSIGITNAIASAVLVSGSLIGVAMVARRRFGLVPSRVQLVVESGMEFLLSQLTQATGNAQKARELLPVILTLVVFITVANQFSLIPLVGQIVLGDTPVFRTVTSDLNATLALALMVVGLAHYLAFRLKPVGHLLSYLPINKILAIRRIKDVPAVGLDVFLAILDIIGEIAKVLSLSFRLFGNVFAGEVMVAVIAGLAFATQFFVPIPFIFLGIFSGFVQAFVFGMLAIQFVSVFIREE